MTPDRIQQILEMPHRPGKTRRDAVARDIAKPEPAGKVRDLASLLVHSNAVIQKQRKGQ